MPRLNANPQAQHGLSLLPPQAQPLVAALQHLHTEALAGPLPIWAPTGKGGYILTHQTEAGPTQSVAY